MCTDTVINFHFLSIIIESSSRSSLSLSLLGFHSSLFIFLLFPVFQSYMVSEPKSLSMASNPQQSSSSTSQRELSPMEDPYSPFFLHHGESPGAILVSQPLTKDNYPTWARAMKMALDAKRKLGFVDGSIIASMAVTPLEKKAWSKCNSMISS